MKNKFFSKAISAILALALVIAMIPAVFATEAKDYNYVFNRDAHGITNGDDRHLTNGKYTIDKIVEGKSSPWGFVNHRLANSLSTNSEGYIIWKISASSNTGVVFAPGVDSDSVPGVRAALAFEISASEGVYDASLSVVRNAASTELEVYLIPKSVYRFPVYSDNPSTQAFYRSVEAMGANYRIGKIDLYGSGNDKIDIGRVGLTEENYYLVLVPCGTNESAATNNGSWDMYIKSFKLDAVNASSDAEEYEFDPGKSFAYKNSGKNYTSTYDSENGGTFSATNIQVRRYGSGATYCQYAAFEVNDTVAGDYNLSFMTNVDPSAYAAVPAVYLTTINEQTTLKSIREDKEKTQLLGYFDFSKLTKDSYEMVTTDGVASVLTLEANKKYYIVLGLEKESFEKNKTVYNTDTKTTSPWSGAELPTESRYVQEFHLSGIKLTPVVTVSKDEADRAAAYAADRELYNTLTSVESRNNTVNTFEYSSTATVSVVTQDIATGESVVNDVVNETVAVNAEYTPSAPAVGDNYEFMYWAIGLGANRKIVSFDKDEYSFTVAPGRNLVYAVYRNTNSESKYAFFFDGSKTVMGKTAIDDNAITLPELPGAMPGFGSSTGWKYTGEEDEVALSAGTTVSDLTDDTFFVADYDNVKTVTLTIDGKEVEVSYGADVNLGDYASLRENKSGENVFNYWKKGDEIISFKPDYTFKAYEDCTLTSTYAKYEPINKSVRRILISADATTGITFAEFIGLDNAIEKGILFGDAEATYTTASVKAVMQTNGKVFSVVNETGKTAIGYAILSNGKIVYSDR